jgi:SOS-response transcriptional repressor LexA
MMDAKERLREVRKFLKLSQEVLAIETGSQRTTVAGYENGVSLPRSEFLKALSLKYGINPNWILTGQGDMLNREIRPQKSRLDHELEEVIASQVSPKFSAIEERLARLEAAIGGRGGYGAAEAEDGDGGDLTGEAEPEYRAEEQTAEEEPEEWIKVPYVENVAAGPPIAQSEDQTGLVSVPARHIRKKFRYYAAAIRGTSMAEVGIRDGDMVLIRCTDTPANGAIQVVRHEGKSTLKRLRETRGGGWELHYEDGSGKVLRLESGDYEVQGEFVTVLPGIRAPEEGKNPPETHEKPLENR